jgi:ribosomal protein S18 acetylase RimI-like enzyme
MAEIVEVAGREEIEAVAGLARSIWTEHYTPIIGAAQVEYMLENFQSAGAISEQIGAGARYFLVRDDGREAGYMALVPDDGEAGVKLSKFYVSAGFRGRGLGRAMFERAVEFCRERGAARLWLTVNKHNDPSLAVYRRLGFARADAVVTDIGGGFVMDDYVLEKTID